MALFNVLLGLHVLSVVWWIGGVFTVTTSLLPIFNHLPAEERIRRIGEFERRFAKQARLAIILAGITGFWMLHLRFGWGFVTSGQGWWIGLMIIVWVLFTMMLFVIEPLGLPRKLGIIHKPRVFLIIHAFLLTLALAAIFFGMIYANGGW